MQEEAGCCRGQGEVQSSVLLMPSHGQVWMGPDRWCINLGNAITAEHAFAIPRLASSLPAMPHVPHICPCCLCCSAGAPHADGHPPHL
jgi:hypothetical protein